MSKLMPDIKILVNAVRSVLGKQSTKHVSIGLKLYKDEYGYVVVDNNTACNGKLVATGTHTFTLK